MAFPRRALFCNAGGAGARLVFSLSRETAAMSLAFVGKFTDLVAKLSDKGEAQAALQGLAGIEKFEGRKAERFLVVALEQVRDAISERPQRQGEAAAEGGAPWPRAARW